MDYAKRIHDKYSQIMSSGNYREVFVELSLGSLSVLVFSLYARGFRPQLRSSK